MELTTLAVVLGWAVGAIGGFLSQHLLRDASRPVRLGVPGLALAAGIGLGLFLGAAMFGLGIGFAVGFTWGGCPVEGRAPQQARRSALGPLLSSPRAQGGAGLRERPGQPDLRVRG